MPFGVQRHWTIYLLAREGAVGADLRFKIHPVRARFSLRHRHRRTSHPVADQAADTKIPHRWGRARKDGTILYHGMFQPGHYSVRPPRS